LAWHRAFLVPGNRVSEAVITICANSRTNQTTAAARNNQQATAWANDDVRWGVDKSKVFASHSFSCSVTCFDSAIQLKRHLGNKAIHLSPNI